MDVLIKSKRVSLWASKNKRVSQILIVFIHILLLYIAIILGNLFFQLGVYFSSIYIWIDLAIFATLSLNYPNNKSIFRSQGINFFVFRKFTDFVIVLLSFLLLVVITNSNQRNGELKLESLSVDQLTASVIGPTVLKQNSSGEVTMSVKKSRSDSLKNNKNRPRFKIFLQENKKLEKTKGEKIIYTILALFGSIVLITILALLTCDLACSGATVAALFVSILGVGGVLFLFFLIMRNLHKKRNLTSNK